MAHHVCLKCGSKKVDDGSNLILSILGVGLLIVSAYTLTTCFSSPFTANWEDHIPFDHTNCLPELIAFCLGLSMLFQGLYRSERIRCLKCGTVWTPPKHRVIRSSQRPS